jgi:hypothetical protein
MQTQKTQIHVEADDPERSAVFYEALFGAAPVRRSATAAVFELDSPPLILTLEQRVRRVDRPLTTARSVRASRRQAESGQFTLIVNEPQHVGDAAIALRRAGVRLRLGDEGVEAFDPDQNAWRVRFVASAAGRTIVAT